MRYLKIFALMIGLMFSTSAMAELSPQNMVDLSSAKHGVITMEEMEQEGIITRDQSLKGRTFYLDKANEIQKYGSGTELKAFEDPNIKVVEAELTTAQKVVGAITFMSVLYVIATFVFVISVVVIFKDVFIVFFMALWSLPKVFYESFAYIASMGVIGAAYFVPEFTQPLAFLGVIGLGGSMIMSSFIRELEPNMLKFSTIMLVVSVPVAIFFASPWVGFISSVAFMGAMGFSVLVTPGCVCLGFTEEKHISPGIVSAFYLLAATIGMSLANVPGIEIFKDGGIWMGSFVGYIGLLIVSSKWYSTNNYAFLQLVTIVLGIAALAVGNIFGFPVLAKIGGTFFVLYLIEKLFEIPAKSAVAYATLGLIASSSVGGLYYATQAYPQLAQYLFLM